MRKSRFSMRGTEQPAAAEGAIHRLAVSTRWAHRNDPIPIRNRRTCVDFDEPLRLAARQIRDLARDYPLFVRSSKCCCAATNEVLAAYFNLTRRIEVKKVSLSIAAAAALLMTAGTAGFATELPSFEVTGLPVSSVQVQVLGAANVQEQSPVATSAVSPVQLSVLTPRTKMSTETATQTAGLSTR
jgi:hypothetical protein